jgi:hypothetical protein
MNVVEWFVCVLLWQEQDDVAVECLSRREAYVNICAVLCFRLTKNFPGTHLLPQLYVWRSVEQLVLAEQ